MGMVLRRHVTKRFLMIQGHALDVVVLAIIRASEVADAVMSLNYHQMIHSESKMFEVLKQHAFTACCFNIVIFILNH